MNGSSSEGALSSGGSRGGVLPLPNNFEKNDMTILLSPDVSFEGDQADGPIPSWRGHKPTTLAAQRLPLCWHRRTVALAT
jgi:hypothetical protein